MKSLHVFATILSLTSITACGQDSNAVISEEKPKYNVTCYNNNDGKLINEDVYSAGVSEGSTVYFYKTSTDEDKHKPIMVANSICVLKPL